MREHLDTLYRYASGCRHVTEFGVNEGQSTVAFLMAEPETLVSYDTRRTPEIMELERLARDVPKTEWSFVQASTYDVTLFPTDLLLIDSDHHGAAIAHELALHAGQVRRWILIHDTESFGEMGSSWDGGAYTGLWPAIRDFLRARPEWRLHHHYRNCHGLTILERR